MAESYDGEIQLAVGLSPGNVKKSAAALQKEISKIFENSAGKNLDKDFAKLQVRMSSTASKAEQLVNKMSALENVKIPTQEYKEIQAQISQTIGKQSALQESFDKIAEGVKRVSPTRFKEMQYEVAELENTLQEAKRELKELTASGQAFTLGSDTEGYQKLTAQLADTNNQSRILLGTYSQLASRQRELGASTQQQTSEMSMSQRVLSTLSGSLNRLGQSAGSAATEIRAKLANSAKELSEKLRQKLANSLNKVGDLLHGKFNQGLSLSNINLKKGIWMVIKYGFGIRSLYFLFRKLRTAIVDSFKVMAQMNDGNNKVNESLSMLTTSLSQLKNAFGAAFAPIVTAVAPAINSLINMLSNAFTQVAQFIALLSGQSTFLRATKVQKDYAKSLKGTGAAAEEAEGKLASFDDLDVLGEDKSGGGGAGAEDVSGMFEEVPVDDVFPGLRKFLQDFFLPFKEAWDNVGQDVMDAWKYALESVFTLWKDIAKSFLKVWTNGSGTKFLTNILTIIKDIGLIVGNLATAFDEAWNKNEIGTQIFQDIMDILNLITDALVECADYTAEWSKNLDFYPLLESIEGVLSSIKNVLAPILDMGTQIYEKVILPIVEWVTETALPTILYVISGALDVIAAVLERIKPIASWLLDNVLIPIGEAIGGVFIDFLKGIGDKLKWIADNEIAVTILESLALAIGIVTTALTLWNVVAGIATAVSTALGIAVAILTSPITLVILAITALIAVGILLYQNWDTIKAKADVVWGKIKEVIGKALEGAEKYFQRFADGVKAIWEGITGLIKDHINRNIEAIEKFCNGIISGVNKVIDTINGLHFDVPEWVTAATGITSLGFNIPRASEIKLPRLATGAVIPPNNEFLAVLGDQRQGTNIEAPLDTIVQAFEQVVGNLQVQNTGYSEMQVDGQTFARLMVPYVVSELHRQGYNTKILEG